MTDMNDPRSLARLARSLLASATDATLLLTQPVRAREETALLHDGDGAPQLWCERGSSVAAAARLRQPAVLKVGSRTHTGAPLSVALVGRLHHIAVAERAGQLVDVVGLSPARVSVEVGREPNVRTHLVALDEYRRHAPDLVAAYASRLVSHTNAGHQPELRDYVIDRFRLPPSVVAGAVLTSLDRNGATLRWVDAAGSHTTHLAFDRPAACPGELAMRLRDHLTAL